MRYHARALEKYYGPTITNYDSRAEGCVDMNRIVLYASKLIVDDVVV